MDRAINTTTKYLVSAFEVFRNQSYQNRNPKEWLSPLDSLKNADQLRLTNDIEQPVHYVKEYEYILPDGRIVSVAPKFSLYPGSTGKSKNETAEHAMLKNWLFGRLKHNDITIQYSCASKPNLRYTEVKLHDLPIDWNNYSVEVPSKGLRRFKADILLPFLTRDPLLGHGLVFEIQLSPQTPAETQQRSFTRALQGYSTIWLLPRDITLDKKERTAFLTSNRLSVESFAETLDANTNRIMGDLKDEYETQARKSDVKLSQMEGCMAQIDAHKQHAIFDIRAEALKTISNVSQMDFEEIKALAVQNIVAAVQQPLQQSVLAYHMVTHPPTCPKCQNPMKLRASKAFPDSHFWGCTAFPACKSTLAIPKGLAVEVKAYAKTG